MNDLPHVDFEIFGFLHLVWILAEYNHQVARITETFVKQSEAQKRWSLIWSVEPQ